MEKVEVSRTVDDKRGSSLSTKHGQETYNAALPVVRQPKHINVRDGILSLVAQLLVKQIEFKPDRCLIRCRCLRPCEQE